MLCGEPDFWIIKSIVSRVWLWFRAKLKQASFSSDQFFGQCLGIGGDLIVGKKSRQECLKSLSGLGKKTPPSLKLTANAPENGKLEYGIRSFPFWDGPFSDTMLVSGRVTIQSRHKRGPITVTIQCQKVMPYIFFHLLEDCGYWLKKQCAQRSRSCC